MQSRTTWPFLEEQEAVRAGAEHLLVDAHELPALTPQQRIDVIERVVGFAAEVLLPRAQAHEQIVCPALSRLPGREASAADAAHDRDLIRHRIWELATADPADVGHLQEVLYALHLLLTNSFTKEAEAYLRLVRAEPREDVERLFARVTSVSRAAPGRRGELNRRRHQAARAAVPRQ